MKIIWDITVEDINKIKKVVDQGKNAFVEYRISKNIHQDSILIDKNSTLKCLIMCLLTSQQRSGPNSVVATFLRQHPFPLSDEIISAESDVESFLQTTLRANGLNRFVNKISNYFVTNYNKLIDTNWALLETFENLKEISTKEAERIIADNLNDTLIGFGPKQSRNFLQALGLTKYEIPIDSRIIDWLNRFGFPVRLKSTALQDKYYYHFVSDGIQILCDKAEVYPCVLDAVIFSSFDNKEWTRENNIY